MLTNANILKKVYIPKPIIVISIISSELVNFILSLLPLFLLLLILRKGLTISLLFLPIPIFIMIIFSLGISLILSAITVFFYDIGDIYQLVLNPLMYFTPILYPLDIIPARFQPLMKINPLYYLIECFRTPIYQGRLPEPLYVFLASLIAAAALVIGMYVFSRLSDRFIYYI